MPAAANWGIPEVFSSPDYKAFPFFCLPLSLYQNELWWLTPLLCKALNKQPLLTSLSCFHLFPHITEWASINSCLHNTEVTKWGFSAPSPLDFLLAKLLSHFSRVRLCATPWTAAHQAPLSLEFSRQEHWSGLPFPSPVHESEVKVKSLSRVRLCDPMDCSLSGSSVHGICQARVREWVAIAFSRIFFLPP